MGSLFTLGLWVYGLLLAKLHNKNKKNKYKKKTKIRTRPRRKTGREIRILTRTRILL